MSTGEDRTKPLVYDGTTRSVRGAVLGAISDLCAREFRPNRVVMSRSSMLVLLDEIIGIASLTPEGNPTADGWASFEMSHPIAGDVVVTPDRNVPPRTAWIFAQNYNGFAILRLAA